MSICKGNTNQIEATRKAVNQGQGRTCQPTHPHRNKNAASKSIRAKQKRLLMLKYAVECSMSKNKCGSTCTRMHCHTMTKLWAHMRTCSDRACAVKHCYSSRAVLTHYHRCVDKSCSICAPMRLLRSMETGRMPGLPSKATKAPVRVCSSVSVQTPQRSNTTIQRIVTNSSLLNDNPDATNITPV